MSFFENTRKPVGFGGKIMVAMMNLGHSAVARWGLQFLNTAPDAKVLDCGCGGGANIRRLLKKCPQGVVKGIDYSPVSVEKSKKVNDVAIAEGRCAVLQGSVADMMFTDNWFDAVTAFETVYFWPDLPRCFREVYRVLKVGGTFLICNEASGDTDKEMREKQTDEGQEAPIRPQIALTTEKSPLPSMSVRSVSSTYWYVPLQYGYRLPVF